MLKTFTPRGLLALAVVFVLAAALAVGIGGAQAGEAAVRHATGTFEVAVVPADPEVVEAGLGLGQMLAGGPGGSTETGTYVALERFVGTLDGRDGAFLLAHRGDMTPEGFTLSITVVPNSGTGALTGVAGDFGLTVTDGVHHYDLAYTLPE